MSGRRTDSGEEQLQGQHATDGVADRMVIEWSDMVNYGNPASPATFQAILELNKGSRAGTITFNYLDLIVGAPAGDGGPSAAVGIKAAGTSGGNRVLASLDRPGNPAIQILGNGIDA